MTSPLRLEEVAILPNMQKTIESRKINKLGNILTRGKKKNKTKQDEQETYLNETDMNIDRAFKIMVREVLAKARRTIHQ